MLTELHFISNNQCQFISVIISLRNNNNHYNCYVLIIIIIIVIIIFLIISLFGSIIIIYLRNCILKIWNYKNHFVLQYIDPEHVEELSALEKWRWERESEVERDVKKIIHSIQPFQPQLRSRSSGFTAMAPAFVLKNFFTLFLPLNPFFLSCR